jgi:hypothetical protein
MYRDLKGILAVSIVCPLVFAVTLFGTMPFTRWGGVLALCLTPIAALILLLSLSEKPWRFSIRSLLIGMTLVAIALGFLAALRR